MGPDRTKACNEQVRELVDAGIIRAIQYQTWVANLVMVPKSNGQWHMCIYFKDLNKARPKDRCPFPLRGGCVGSVSLQMFLGGLQGVSSDPYGHRRSVGMPTGGFGLVRVNRHLFGIAEGKFLGVIVTKDGFKENPEKVGAIIKMPSSAALKQVQTLNGCLMDLNRFLANHADKSFPFVSTLRNCLKKTQFRWTPEVESTFQEIKSRMIELPTMTAPLPKEPLTLYLSASNRAVDTVQ
ncbi:uncharacterized protein LOC143630987 [Bidens hawaiensis]|uniref:uncharacterized protein LOC143630987 n=1 Tax=Bidens hawaiensis TaxID=980011 RepID=UPI004049D5B5